MNTATNQNDVNNLSLQALQTAYASGDVTPRQLIGQLLAQARRQSEYNAWIHLLDEAELEPYLLALEAQDSHNLPLYGVPFAIKDNIDLAGVPTTAACPDFAYTPTEHAAVVSTLIAAGAVPLGKTNLDQFATGLVGTRSPYGEGKNSFNTDYISGGSSAGSAIATALGQVSFALGTDTAGSGRVPAVLNNLVGHKPTKGLLSTRGVVPACRTLDCVSIFALSCDDAAVLLDIAGSYDAEDPYARPNTFYNRQRYFDTAGGRRFRFGVPAELDFQDDAGTRALFTESVERLKALGGEAVTVDFDPFLETARLLYEGPWISERALATQDVDPASMLPVINEIIAGAEGKTAADAFAAQYRLATLKRHCDSLLEDLDFVVTPTCPRFYTRAEMAEQPIVNNSLLGTYTNFVNLLDYSATAVPVGFTECGIPWGVTLFSAAFKDIRLLGFAGLLHRDCQLPLGATGHTPLPPSAGTTAAVADRIDVVVCGAHLQGQPLNWQLTERGAQLVSKSSSSAHYQLYALPDGKRPAMVRNEVDGTAIEVEVWSMPHSNFGSFVAAIPAPLGIGKVELADGAWLSGFICDGFGLAGAKDISAYGSWRSWLAAQQSNSAAG
ncbi:Allophanate hydrolase [Halioglobus japonicus]|nr:Allophanate hydrolase [Halioglobus japonicus]